MLSVQLQLIAVMLRTSPANLIGCVSMSSASGCGFLFRWRARSTEYRMLLAWSSDHTHRHVRAHANVFLIAMAVTHTKKQNKSRCLLKVIVHTKEPRFFLSYEDS